MSTDMQLCLRVYTGLYMHKYAGIIMQKFSRDSAVFMYKDLLKAPIPAGDMAATWQTEGGSIQLV